MESDNRTRNHSHGTGGERVGVLPMATRLTLDWGDAHWQGLSVPVFWDETWEKGTFLSLLRQHLALQPRLALDSCSSCQHP